HPLGSCWVRTLQQCEQRCRNDLPRQAVFIFQPAALYFLPAFSEPVPKMIDFLLRLAIDDERNRFGKLELRSAVEGCELQPLEFERDGHDAAFRSGAAFAVPIYSQYSRI